MTGEEDALQVQRPSVALHMLPALFGAVFTVPILLFYEGPYAYGVQVAALAFLSVTIGLSVLSLSSADGVSHT